MRRILILLLLLPVAACDSSPSSLGEGPGLSEEAIAEHLHFFAADSMYGRKAGSEYERRAAEYIRGEFIDYGLEPGGADYFQSFIVTDPRILPVDTQDVVQSQNVLGVLPGEGALAGQWIIVGAHYDHLGFSRVSIDSVVVFNGADDNASGTSLMLELARVLSEDIATGSVGGGSRRSIMFQAFGAEELGLVGSTQFCEQPTVSMDDVVAMLNFDMVGRLSQNGLTLIGASSSSDWPGLVDDANPGPLSYGYSDELLRRSDQYCFYERARPVLFFHTGLHLEYHTPFDDTWLIDRTGMLRIGDLARNLLLDLAVRPDPPTPAGR